MISGTLEVCYTLEYLRVLIYTGFASLYSVYLGASPIPQVQMGILNTPNPYLRNTTVLHYSEHCYNAVA